jgi:hypothetical protein
MATRASRSKMLDGLRDTVAVIRETWPRPECPRWPDLEAELASTRTACARRPLLESATDQAARDRRLPPAADDELKKWAHPAAMLRRDI